MRCACCGSTELRQHSILWPELTQQWELSPAEAAYIDRQQGLTCTRCGGNLRSLTLAQAIMRRFDYTGLFIDFIETPAALELSVLEINEAGTLTLFLRRLPRHVIVRYPQA